MEQTSNKIKENWAIAEKRQFCKQSCTKISQGLDKLDPRSGDRAIWELFQNARDLARANVNDKKEAHIKITLTESEFIFAHQGLPFTHDTFGSLVKQVSSQTKEDEDAVGQYGTGFLTTHVFGRQIYVSGSLDMEDQMPGKFININKFNIDRTFDSLPEFVGKMAKQLCEIEKLADAPKVDRYREWTEFHYQLNTAEGAIAKAKKAIDTAKDIMPYVMVVNEPIGDVTLCIDGETTIQYSKEQLPNENDLKVMDIKVSTNTEDILKKRIYYLQSLNGDTIILPLSGIQTAKSLDGIAKLFVYFPLLGTENFGMDFIFHSDRFYPVEERDGIHLPVENPNVRTKFETNEIVLNEMTDILFKYLKTHFNDITNWCEISALKFETIDNKEDFTNMFFNQFKDKWVKFLEKLTIIPVDETKMAANSGLHFFSSDIVNAIGTKEYAGYFNDLYSVSAVSSKLPCKAEMIAWSNILSSWYASDNRVFLDCDAIAKGYSENDGAATSALHGFDMFLKKIGHTELFDTYPIILNRDGKHKRKSDIRNANTIPDWLYEITKKIVLSDTERFVNREFADIDEFTTFGRNDLRKSISDYLTQLRRNTLDEGKCYDKNILITLAQLSSIFKDVDKSAKQHTMPSIRRLTMPLICHHLSKDYKEELLPKLPEDKEEYDIAQLPFQHLVENMLLEISMKNNEWVLENKDYIHSLHDALQNWNNYFDSKTPSKDCFASKYGAYPNMHYVPCMAKDLKQGVDIDDDLFKLYESVFKKDLKDELVNEEYISFYAFEKVEKKDIAKKIEDFLVSEKYENENILDIINNLEKKEWDTLFPHIAEKKADLFMKQVKPECKDGVFRLMKINDPKKLNQLADLAKEDNIDEIIKLGKESLLNKENKEADFEYKKSLGRYVEDCLQKELAQQISPGVGNNNLLVSVRNEQCGHDLVVYLSDTPIYYLEVKSRWSHDQSVMMSPLQLKTSVKEKDRYSLCCADMTQKERNDVEKHIYPKTIKDTINRIKIIHNIGTLNEKIFKAIEPPINYDNIYIDGDFKCVIPQKIIMSSGKDFMSLIKIISDKIASTPKD